MVQRRAGRGLKPAGRALEPAERASEPARRALEPAGRVLEPAGRVSEPAGGNLKPARRPCEASWEAQSHLGWPAEAGTESPTGPLPKTFKGS